MPINRPDDDRFDTLFSGRKGSVLGEHTANTPTVDDPAPTSSAAKAKMKAAAEQRLPPRRDHDRRRVPPGQKVVDKWPVLDLGHQPSVPKSQWTLDIKGAVARPLSLDWDAFHGLTQSRVDADIHCVTAWSLLDNVWEGVRTCDLIARVQPDESVRHVIFHAHDGYRTNVTMARFQAENALLAHTWNGTEISREHGGPMRIILPDLYFWKSAKWVRQITFLANDVKGYWEALGYHIEGDPWREERYE